jgi:transcriptional regulator with GAF, ATPase, and Fis domain
MRPHHDQGRVHLGRTIVLGSIVDITHRKHIEETLGHVVSQTRRLLNASASSIYRLDASDGRLSVRAQQGLPDQFLERAEDVVGDCAIQRAVVQGNPVAVGDLLSAEELIVSRSTIKFHVSNILSKLTTSSRTEAVAVAIQHGLVASDKPRRGAW